MRIQTGLDTHLGYTSVLRSQPPFTGVLRGPGRRVPPGVFFECFGAPGSECPKEGFLSVFGVF